MSTTTEITTGRAGEAGHWYRVNDDGQPEAAYEVPRAKPGKNGETHRAATLRDAKALGLLGSYSTVWRLRANPALDNWKQGNAIMAALTSPRRAEYEAGTIDEEAFLASVIADAAAEGKGAADEGTQVHAAIEQALLDQPFDQRWAKHVANALVALAGIAPLPEWRAEVVFAQTNLGYGGKIDAECDIAVVDFKTVKPWSGKPPVYDSWACQLEAYVLGLQRDYCQTYNIVISRGDDATVAVVHHDDATRAAAREEWLLTLKLWLHTSGMGRVLGVRP